ncbi:MAG TPA: hypothetical protein VHX68_11095 [Planctomycetaceae bacterium]|nr:hypothetical protein [Planctomycetaceae bacterium]
MTRIFLLLVPLFAGCGETATIPPESPPALSDADFDGWRGNASAKQSLDATQATGILSTILDRVESIEAKLRPPAASVAPMQPAPRPRPVAEPVARPLPVAGPPVVAASSPQLPPPAPPAEPLAAAGSDISVETLDIPKGWTGAAVYHAATCPHCPPLLAGLKSRATKVSGNYLRVEGCWFLLVDWDQRPDVERPKIPGLPAVLYFIDGHERTTDRVIGFGNRPGELDAVIAKHPLFQKRANVGSAQWRTSLPFGFQIGPAAQEEWQAGPPLGGPYVYETVVPNVPAYCGSSLSLFPAQHSAGISLFGLPVLSGSMGTSPTAPVCGPGGCR